MFGLFTASGGTQLENPALLTLQALQISLVHGAPHDYRKAIAPRFGIAYGLSADGGTVRSAISSGRHDSRHSLCGPARHTHALLNPRGADF